MSCHSQVQHRHRQAQTRLEWPLPPVSAPFFWKKDGITLQGSNYSPSLRSKSQFAQPGTLWFSPQDYQSKCQEQCGHPLPAHCWQKSKEEVNGSLDKASKLETASLRWPSHDSRKLSLPSPTARSCFSSKEMFAVLTTRLSSFHLTHMVWTRCNDVGSI